MSRDISFMSNYRMNDVIKNLQEFSDKNNNPYISIERITLMCFNLETQEKCGVKVNNTVYIKNRNKEKIDNDLSN